MPGLVAYNPNGIVENALQFGTIVMSVNGSVNLGSLDWCPGFGICNEYIIITDTYTNGRTSQANAMPMGFCTADLSDAALIESINKLAASKSSGPFANMNDAITWAIIEGYFIINQDYPSIVTSGCVLNLDAGLPASYPLVLNQWYDLSGNGNTGILNNTITYSSSSYGNLEFNSIDSDYITFASTSNIPSGNDNYTISTWFNPSSLGTKGLVGWGSYGSTNEVNALALSGSGIINYWGGNDLYATASLSTGSWYNVVAVYDGTTREIWLNGSSIANDTPVGHNVTYTGNLTVGLTDTSEYFDGKIGEVQVFNRALLSTEIAQNYNALLPRYNGTYVDPCNAPPYCTPTINLTPTPTPTPTFCPLSCGGTYFGSYDPDNSAQQEVCLNLTSTSNGSSIFIQFDAVDRPNRFTLYDSVNPSPIYSTGWMGTTSPVPGPWNPPGPTPSGTTFIYDSSRTYYVIIDIAAYTGLSDTYTINVVCTPPVSPTPTPTITPTNTVTPTDTPPASIGNCGYFIISQTDIDDATGNNNTPPQINGVVYVKYKTLNPTTQIVEQYTIGDAGTYYICGDTTENIPTMYYYKNNVQISVVAGTIPTFNGSVCYSDGQCIPSTPTPTITRTPTRTPTPTPTSPTYSVNVFVNVQSIPQAGDTSWKFYYTTAGPTTSQLGGLISSTSCNSLGQISGLKYGDTLYFGGVSNSNVGIQYYYGYTPNISDCADATIFGCNKPFTANLGTGSTMTVTGTTNLYLTARVVSPKIGFPTEFVECNSN